jgi:exosortase
MREANQSSGRFLLGPLALWFAALAVASLLWAYAPTLAGLESSWAQKPQYSHGYLVPAFALVLLWLRRSQMEPASWRPSAWGFAFLVAGVALRLAGAYFYFPWFDAVSLLPCLVGLALLWGGWSLFRWAWPALAFLVFLFPLPYRLETALGQPLQRITTLASTYFLQTLGLPALAEGNTILLDDVRIGIVEACSGLSMLMVFIALATATALLLRRPLWEKLLLVGSALPIAILANIARVTVTALLHELVGDEEADSFFHDWAGWFMMPLAVALILGEMRLWAWLFQPIPSQAALPLALSPTRGLAVTGRPPTASGKARTPAPGATTRMGRGQDF